MAGPPATGSKLDSKLERRVASAARTALERQKFVSPVDVLTGIGWVPQSLVDDWRRGRVDDLESVAPVPLHRLAEALVLLTRWAQETGLRRTEGDYLAATRDRRPLRFTSDAAPTLELAFRTHWVSPHLSDTARERLTQRQSQAPDLVVVSPLRDWTCASCGEADVAGGLLVMEDPGPLCLTCVDLDHLVFVQAGDAALTRRAKKASRLSAIVVRFSRPRKRCERRGILVEEAALEAAEQQCLADDEARQRRRERDRERRADEDLVLRKRMTAEIRRLFPGCPAL